MSATDIESLVAAVRTALVGRTRSVSDEIQLHQEIAAALAAAGLTFEREVIIPGAGRIDFIVAGAVALEVKGIGGGGLGPARQLFRYLEDPRFEAGVLLTIRPLKIPVTSYTRADGSVVPVHQIDLWKNSL